MNRDIILFSLGVFLGLIIGGVIGISSARDAADINAVLSHQVDEQARLIGDIIGTEAADEIRRVSHERALKIAGENK